MKQVLFILAILIPALAYSQTVRVKEAMSDLNSPQITWITTIKVDSLDFQLFRATIKEKQFHKIETIHFVKPFESSDTTEFTIVDTTLTVKGIYLYYIQLLSSNKVLKSAVAVCHNFGLIPEPQLNTFIATPLKDRKAVTLDWQLSYPQTVSSMALYRSKSYDTGYLKIADLSPKMLTYTDVIPVANEPWFYFMVIKTWFGNEISSVRIPAFATFAEKPFVPQNVHAYFEHDTVFIDWKNTGKNIIGARVYRSINKQPFVQINEMEANTVEHGHFIDYSNEVKNNTVISYFVRNVSDGFIESNSSDTINFYIAEHEPVLPPTEADYIITPDNSIKLLWVPPTTGLVIAYNLYLISDKDTTLLTPSSTKQNFYTDTAYRSAGKYRYEIESVGFKGKLSENRTPVTVFRYKPNLHVIIDLAKKGKGIAVSWKQPLNKHLSKVSLYKQSGDNQAVLFRSLPPTEDQTIMDNDVQHGITYLYKLVGMMQNGDEITLNKGVQIRY